MIFHIQLSAYRFGMIWRRVNNNEFYFWVNYPCNRHFALEIFPCILVLRNVAQRYKQANVIYFMLSFSSTQNSSDTAPRSHVQSPVSGACQGRSCISSAIWQREAQTSHLKLHNSQRLHNYTPAASTRSVDKWHDISGHRNGRLNSTFGTVG